MNLSEFKKILTALDAVNFIQSNGELVPAHFHVTEVGITSKKYIDCGGTVREEEFVNFQLWEATDFDHRIAPDKLLDIIDLSEKTLGIIDSEIEIEYQTSTISKYGLDFNGKYFMLIPKQTNCLATDKCGAPKNKVKLSLFELQNQDVNSCEPGSGCCN